MSSDVQEGPKVAVFLDRIIERIGKATSWLNGALIFVIILQVVLRYVFGKGLVVLEELQWHLYAAGIMIGLSYCITTDSHIRLDIMHDRFSKRTQEKIEIFGIIFLLMPFIIIIFLHSIDFVWESIRLNEHSDAPMGLPFRWIIKSVIPLSFLLLFLAGIARLIRAIHFLKTDREGGGDGR